MPIGKLKLYWIAGGLVFVAAIYAMTRHNTQAGSQSPGEGSPTDSGGGGGGGLPTLPEETPGTARGGSGSGAVFVTMGDGVNSLGLVPLPSPIRVAPAPTLRSVLSSGATWAPASVLQSQAATGGWGPGARLSTVYSPPQTSPGVTATTIATASGNVLPHGAVL